MYCLWINRRQKKHGREELVLEDKEWQKKYGHDWQDATRKEVKTHCTPRCPRCQGTLHTVNVHGHEQCVLCHAIVEDCCQGSQLK